MEITQAFAVAVVGDVAEEDTRLIYRALDHLTQQRAKNSRLVILVTGDTAGHAATKWAHALGLCVRLIVAVTDWTECYTRRDMELVSTAQAMVVFHRDKHRWRQAIEFAKRCRVVIRMIDLEMSGNR